jgi:hypothetical protein
VCQNTCRGLFQRHHLAFCFSISAAVARRSGHLKEEEWSYLLKGTSSQSEEHTSACPPPSNVSQAAWKALQQLAAHVPRFQSVASSCSSDTGFWERYMAAEEPWKLQPDTWNVQASGVEWSHLDHVFIAKCCVPQRLVPCVQVSLPLHWVGSVCTPQRQFGHESKLATKAMANLKPEFGTLVLLVHPVYVIPCTSLTASSRAFSSWRNLPHFSFYGKDDLHLCSPGTLHPFNIPTEHLVCCHFTWSKSCCRHQLSCAEVVKNTNFFTCGNTQ